MDLGEFKITFDGILENYVTQKIQQAKSLLDNEKLNKYIEYIETFIFSGGKRIRPYGLWVTYTGFGGTDEKAILNFGIIFELLHSMALIHDDIIDQATKRHNILTVHEYVHSMLKKTDKYIAEGQAILIGDLILARVYELRHKEHNFPKKNLDEARQNVHSMIEEVILGQIIDVDMMSGEPATLEMIEKKNMYKTASYTFARPMVTGAILGGASAEDQKLIIELGKYIGLAFQVRDDLFDITSGDKTKSAFSDIQEGQQTFFTHYIFNNGTEKEKQMLQSCMRRRLNEEEIKTLQKIFAKSGAIDFGKKLIKKYATEAENVLKKIAFKNESSKGGILALIKKISELKI